MFVLRFPAATPPAAESGPRPVIEAPRSCRFLLVDDDAENLDSLSENLVRRGHQVDAALSGPQALEKLRSGAVYDVILCDLGMPGMSGWEVARLAREIAAGLDFYIVTGWGREIEGEIPASVSVSGVLAKPIDLNEVARIAALAVANRDAAQGADVAAGEPRPGSAVR
jgi:CheY-like chemotaxis protein